MKRSFAIWLVGRSSPNNAMLFSSAAPEPARAILPSPSRRPTSGTVHAAGSSTSWISSIGWTRQGRQGRLADYLTRLDFIVLDELGYLPFAQAGGQLLFHLVSRLYERTSIIVTTNSHK